MNGYSPTEEKPGFCHQIRRKSRRLIKKPGFWPPPKGSPYQLTHDHTRRSPLDQVARPKAIAYADPGHGRINISVDTLMLWAGIGKEEKRKNLTLF